MKMRVIEMTRITYYGQTPVGVRVKFEPIEDFSKTENPDMALLNSLPAVTSGLEVVYSELGASKWSVGEIVEVTPERVPFVQPGTSPKPKNQKS